jgi:hypothetical protein
MSGINNSGDLSEGGSQNPESRECTGCFCEILHDLVNEDTKTGQQRKMLIVNKGTTSPLSIDGTGNPTIFTLVKSDPATSSFVFTYDDDFNGTTPYAPVTGTFLIYCHAIAGISFIDGDFF